MLKPRCTPQPPHSTCRAHTGYPGEPARRTPSAARRQNSTAAADSSTSGPSTAPSAGTAAPPGLLLALPLGSPLWLTALAPLLLGLGRLPQLALRSAAASTA